MLKNLNTKIMMKWEKCNFFHLLNSLRAKFIDIAMDSVGKYFLHEKKISVGGIFK